MNRLVIVALWLVMGAPGSEPCAFYLFIRGCRTYPSLAARQHAAWLRRLFALSSPPSKRTETWPSRKDGAGGGIDSCCLVRR